MPEVWIRLLLEELKRGKGKQKSPSVLPVVTKGGRPFGTGATNRFRAVETKMVK